MVYMKKNIIKTPKFLDRLKTDKRKETRELLKKIIKLRREQIKTISVINERLKKSIYLTHDVLKSNRSINEVVMYHENITKMMMTVFNTNNKGRK